MGLRLDRLTYRSTATGTTGSLLNLAAILAESQRNNARDGLTGALAAHKDEYLQVIEGPAQALDSLLRRLSADARHRDLVILDRALIRTRLFGDWGMASARFTPELAPALDAVMAGRELSGDQITALLLQAVARDEDRVA